MEERTAINRARCRCSVYDGRILDGELNFQCYLDEAERQRERASEIVPCSSSREARRERNRQRTRERTREGRNHGEAEARRRESEEHQQQHQQHRSIDLLARDQHTRHGSRSARRPNESRASLRISDSKVGIASEGRVRSSELRRIRNAYFAVSTMEPRRRKEIKKETRNKKKSRLGR